EAGLAQPPVEPAEIALDLRADVRIYQRGAGTLELRRGGHHLVRQRDHDSGQLLGGQLPHPALVRRVDEGEEQDYRQRLDALPLHTPQRTPDRLLVERRHDIPLEVEPLGNAVALPARADRLRRRERRIPDVLLVAAPDLDLVAMAFAGDET